MPTYSQTDLATRVLRYLNLVDVTEAPDADILADTIETITSDLAAMSVRDMPIWNGSVMAVPLQYLLPLAIRLSIPVAAGVGLINPKDVPAACMDAEVVLHQLSSSPATGSVAETQYF